MEKLFPLEIPVMVNEKKLQAMIFSRESKSYLVRFSNGFEDVFTLMGEDDDLGPIGTKEGWTKYGPSLKNDLRCLSYLDDGELVKVFTHTVDGKPTNVWVSKQVPDQSSNRYEIYFNGSCQFGMTLPGVGNTFEITHYSGDDNINLNVAETVLKNLPVLQ